MTVAGRNKRAQYFTHTSNDLFLQDGEKNDLVIKLDGSQPAEEEPG